MTERLVFDAEPLLAYLLDEDGADAVEARIQEVAVGDVADFVSPVTLTEVEYVGRYLGSGDEVTGFLGSLQRAGVRQVDASLCWREAARFKREHQVALGDAYALAAASVQDARLLAGADDDFDSIDDVEVERFRDRAD